MENLKLQLLKDFKKIKNHGRIQPLMDFHANNKYLYFCMDIGLKDKLGNLLGTSTKQNKDVTCALYEEGLNQILNKGLQNKLLANALSHMFGYFKNDLADKEDLLALIDRSGQDEKAFKQALEILYDLAKEYRKTYILNQSIFGLIKKANKNEALLDQVKAFPTGPGIYRFYSQEKIVYVGKSKSLRSRVRSYFNPRHEREKLYIMMDKVDKVDYVLCQSHLQARILEYKTIQELQPIFNAQFKREKTALYFTLDPKKIITINKKNGIGPFMGQRFILGLRESLKRILPITFKDGFYDFEYMVFEKRLDSREIQESLDSLDRIFTSQENLFGFVEHLRGKMEESSSRLEFEKALFFKNLIASFEYVSSTLKERADFLAGTYILEEEGTFSLVDKGQLVLAQGGTSLEEFKSLASGITYDGPAYSQELKSLVFSHTKERGVIVHQL